MRNSSKKMTCYSKRDRKKEKALLKLLRNGVLNERKIIGVCNASPFEPLNVVCDEIHNSFYY